MTVFSNLGIADVGYTLWDAEIFLTHFIGELQANSQETIRDKSVLEM
jgi:hypothetical protein